ncbi:Acg family FMN-binding oxidoreductase [Terricaulis sp.]|uniref:Acg family FMN-binding oxidoreductase n=1 Tax=Terricaulis sp. TaxID=2768686 RepID=UPI0037844A42
MTTRRRVLQLLATAPILSACGKGNLPDPVAAWREPGAAEQDPRRFALAHAILAPNPHNTQPWLVALDGDEGMTLSCDLDRRLPFTDPNDRQITLGCGAFLYNYWIALAQHGRSCTFEFFPEGAPAPGARLDARPLVHARIGAPLADATGPEHYFDQITARRTNRNVYDARVPEAATLQGVVDAATNWLEAGAAPFTAHFETEARRVAALRDLVWRGFDRETRTHGAGVETYKWLRIGAREIAEHRDGLAITQPLAPALKAIGLFGEDDFVNPDSFVNETNLKEWKAKAEGAPAFIWLKTPEDTPVHRLQAGMAYARMNLAATKAGLAMHPWSQTLQEYAEMADLYADAKRLLGAENETVQMLVRVGYAEPVEPAPRRGVDAILRT